jgi:DNA-directed RNA polymerase subunit K/omega
MVEQVSISKGPDVISDKLHYDPDEVYQKNMSPFESVVIAAQEARFINEQARLGFLDLKGVKPTTVALDRLREGKVKVSVEE